MTAANGKSASKRGRGPGKPFVKGDPRRGVGKKGRSGRKPLAFALACSQAADQDVLPKVIDKLNAATPDDPAWRWSAEYVTGYGKGRPPQEVQHTGKDGEAEIRHTVSFGGQKIDF